MRHEHHVIERHTDVLLGKLKAEAFDVAILDCGPGLDHAAIAARALATCQVYVVTPNRSDFLGFLSAAEHYGLDKETAIMVLNHATSVFGCAVKDRIPYGFLKESLVIIHESPGLRGTFRVGRPCRVPTCAEAGFACSKILALAGGFND